MALIEKGIMTRWMALLLLWMDSNLLRFNLSVSLYVHVKRAKKTNLAELHQP